MATEQRFSLWITESLRNILFRLRWKMHRSHTQFILGSGWSVAVGAKGSFMFLDFVTKETKSWTGTHDDYQSMTEHDSYIGFRVIPKLTVFKEI